MAEQQRPAMTDQDWQRLREVLRDEVVFERSCPPFAQARLAGLESALQFMDAVEADAARLRMSDEA